MAVNPGFSELGRDAAMRDPSILGETISRMGHVNTAFTLSSGTLQMTAIYLPANAVVGHLAACSASAGITGPTNWWFGLYDNNLVQLATTANQTTTAWAANTYKSLAVATIASGASSTFTTTYSGLHYFGVLATWSTTAPSLMACALISSGLPSQSPVLCGTSDTGQTTPPAFPHTATALTVGQNPLYCAAAA